MWSWWLSLFVPDASGTRFLAGKCISSLWLPTFAGLLNPINGSSGIGEYHFCVRRSGYRFSSWELYTRTLALYCCRKSHLSKNTCAYQHIQVRHWMTTLRASEFMDASSYRSWILAALLILINRSCGICECHFWCGTFRVYIFQLWNVYSALTLAFYYCRVLDSHRSLMWNWWILLFAPDA